MVHVLLPDKKMKTNWINLFEFFLNHVEDKAVNDVASQRSIPMPRAWSGRGTILSLLHPLVSFIRCFSRSRSEFGMFDPL